MSTDTQANVYVDFIKVFLSQNSTAGCVNVSQSSSDWLISSFGRFSVFTTVTVLQMLNPSFNVLDTLSLLNLRQLVEVSSTPGFLSSAAAVNNLLLYVPDAQITVFFLSLSATLQTQGVVLPSPVQEAFLQQVFNRANLTTSSDADLQIWILNILPSFIANITVQHVTSYFSVILQRPCPISQQAVQLLNSSSSTFQPATQDQIYQLILGSLTGVHPSIHLYMYSSLHPLTQHPSVSTGPAPLHCYANQSYYAFLTSSFMSFQFPNLTTFLSLMPPAHVPELMESVSPAEVSSLLNRPNAVDDVAQICQLFRIYPKTPQYLQTEPLLPVGLARQVLSCIWPRVLKVDVQSEVNQWFDLRLVQYLPLLTSQFIAPDVMLNASCLSFKKFVSAMAKYNYSAAEFSPSDIYSSILVYLNTSSGSTPKCYYTSNPDLNSTTWFTDYISVFLSFITLDDLLQFGSIQPFLVNLDNLQLFAQTSVPDDVMEYYVTLLFEINPSFSAYYLPLKFRCLAPASSFLQLSLEQLKIISSGIHQNCTDVLPDVSAALASNAEVLTVDTIEALGQSSTGLSTAQISDAGGNVLLNSLSMLRLVLGWNLDQAMMIIQTLLSSGVYQINSVASLLDLGSLIIGVQSSIFRVISGEIFLEAVKSELFVTSVIGAPVIIQQTIVSQIIAVNSSSDAIITNVPDLMATEIPRIFLLDVPQSSAAAQVVNRKKWKHEQAVLIFETVTAQFSNPDDMSFQVLQGFTCSRIQSFSTSKVLSLIRGCRRRVNQTLVLQESQLTCMHHYIKSADLSAFSQYPAEVLIYYNYSMIDRSLCRSYFSSLGAADFSVLSSTLSFKKQMLFNHARGCLGISGVSISRVQLDVLGSMSCFLSSEYIQSSDPYVLEKLKPCVDLSAEQISALESILLGGNTSSGPSDSWDRATLESLALLPLYLTANIWSKFTQANKQRFLKTFIRDLRKNDKASEKKILNMMNEVNKISRVKIKRSAETACTVGQILQAQVYSDMFPFAYDVPQFNACLSVQTLKDNLEAVTDRVYDRSYQRIILDKLNQAYPGGLSDQVLQVLGSASHVATPDDVRKWNVMKIDTLSSLMNQRKGDWDPEMVQLLVSKYLSVNGNTLGSNELNALGGTNLCVLNTSVLNNITAASVERASALSLTSCSSEKKSILFSIAQNAFNTTNTRSTNPVSITTYQLLQNYLGGADVTFIRTLVNSTVNMDVLTFMNLKQSVINVLIVSEVKNLLGVNVADLKTYESTAQIQEWIRLQLQVDLDTLQIGLTGGRNSSVTESTVSTTATASSSTKAPSAQTGTAATTAAGSRVWSPVCLQLLLLAVTMTTLQLLHW
uniref:Mesothelin a n=1 Tax=Sinocyclocheilus grahami TaxID=75366 RepID=A0A672L1T3_SINGR